MVVSLGGDRAAGERGRDRGAGERGRPSQTIKGPHRLCKGLWIFAPRNALETSEEFSKLKVGPRVVINNPYYSVGIF